MDRFFTWIIGITLLWTGCSGMEETSGSDQKEYTDRVNVADNDAVNGRKVQLTDTIFHLLRNTDSVRVKIIVPDTVKGYVLVLHGWNLPADEICEHSSLCELFLDSGYVIIQPDFGKSTYQWQNYPQTRKNYLKYPTRSWIQDTFLIHLQMKFNILVPGERNFIVGVSTGGRGAALLALENPDIFKAAACLSADFDHSAIADEQINNGFYGSIKKFPERWTGRDNIHNRAAEFKSGLYLAHGVKDKVCPVSQTEKFSLKLKEANKGLRVQTNIDPEGDHSYVWWDTQFVPVLGFFNGF